MVIFKNPASFVGKMAANFMEYARMANPADNVAIAIATIPAGTHLTYQGDQLLISDRVLQGFKFAVHAIPHGELVRLYGEPTAIAREDINPGEGVESRLSDQLPIVRDQIAEDHTQSKPDYFPPEMVSCFQGIRRSNNRIGTRNYIAIIPTDPCPGVVGHHIEDYFRRAQLPAGVDGVVYIPFGEGCGASPKRVEVSRRAFNNYADHPNVGAAIFLENGCGHLPFAEYRPVFENEYSQKSGKPIAWLSFQGNGCNVAKTRDVGIDMISGILDKVASVRRSAVSTSELVVGTKCGGSDGLSGIAGNLAIGYLSDLIVRSGGSVILTEAPEMMGAAHLLARRARNKDVADAVYAMVDAYEALATARGESCGSNPSRGNRAGGLANIVMKSLGATIKAGTTRVEDCVDWGESIGRKGLTLMQGPGDDIESMTGEVASGANVIVFNTGRGTATGNPIVPVIKLVNTRSRYPDADFFDWAADGLLYGGQSADQVAQELLDLVIEVSSGKRVQAEIHGAREVEIWGDYGVSL